MKREFDFIRDLRNAAQRRPQDEALQIGIGDDAAVWRTRAGCENLITADLLVEEIDFKMHYVVPRWLGHKVLAVSLSDIAAMGGRSRFSMLSLGIRRTLGDEFWKEFFDGYFELADRYEVRLIGGDTSAHLGGLTLDSIVIGECVAGRAVRRSGARLGDDIYLTGSVGGATAGLSKLLDGITNPPGSSELAQDFRLRQLKPEPPVEFGRRVGEARLAHAMIDTSDGLSQDLHHICLESGVSAELDETGVPISPEVSLTHSDPWKAFAAAVNSGEDYELVLTADPSVRDALLGLGDECGVSVSRIGRIIPLDESRLYVNLADGHRHPWKPAGYQHFVDDRN